MKKKFTPPIVKVMHLATESCLLSASDVDYDRDGAITTSLSNERKNIFDDAGGTGMWE